MGEILLNTKFLTAAAALGIGINSAYADGGAGPTEFTLMEAQLAAKAQGRSIPQAIPHGAAATFVYSTNPRSQGTWLSSPSDASGANK